MKLNSFLNGYAEKYLAILSAKENDNLEEKFEIEFFGEKVKVRFRFCPYLTISPDSKKLPVISHFEFRMDGVLKSVFQSGYYSHFFPPMLLNDYTDISKAANDCLMATFKEHNLTVGDIKKEIMRNNQLLLF